MRTPSTSQVSQGAANAESFARCLEDSHDAGVSAMKAAINSANRSG